MNTCTPYFYEHFLETEPIDLEIDEITTCISLLTEISPPTERKKKSPLHDTKVSNLDLILSGLRTTELVTIQSHVLNFLYWMIFLM
jgi:hypothetical protein